MVVVVMDGRDQRPMGDRVCLTLYVMMGNGRAMQSRAVQQFGGVVEPASVSEGLVFLVNNEWSGVPHNLTRQSGTIP